MRNAGYVVNVRGNMVEVVLGEHVECRRCGACMAALGENRRKIEAADEVGVRVGQKVEIEIEPKHAVSSAFLVFILPVIVTLAGGLLGYYLGPELGVRGELGGIVLGSLSFVLSFFLLRRIEKSVSSARIPRIVRAIPDEVSPGGGC